MGILNLSTDSPVDHSITTSDTALKRAMELKQNGAKIIDVGGHSSASNAKDTTTEDEINLVIPIIEKLVNHKSHDFIVSIDSWNPKVVNEAAKVGVHLLNDINGFRNPEMVKVALKYDLPVCLMHMRGEPKGHYNVDQTFSNITEEIIDWCKDRIHNLTSAGIKSEKIIIDPGFEFGKSMKDNLQLLFELKKFHQLNLPILVSASRKAFIAESLGLGRKQKGEGLFEGTLAVQTLSAFFGVQILRVHDVKAAYHVVSFVKKLKEVVSERNLTNL
jgi:dihydropteroate synthase